MTSTCSSPRLRSVLNSRADVAGTWIPGVRVIARGVRPDEDAAPDDWSVLSPGEQARASGMGSERARVAFVVGRSLLRRGLGDALGVPPADVPLADVDGRPVLAIAGPACSLAHTPGLVVVTVATGHAAVGVDVEAADRWPLPPTRTWLTDTEHDRLPAPADDATRRDWVRRWTAKEAVAKALGTGLGTPLTAIAVDRARATVPGHDPATWSLHHLDDWPDHVVTVAVPAD